MRPIPFEATEKLSAINEYVGHRAVAWVDDVLLPETLTWAKARAEPTLLIAVDPSVGLTREHVDRLIKWAHQHLA